MKKQPIAKLEERKVIFTQIGLIFALSLVLCAFEWKSYEKSTFDPDKFNKGEEIIDVIEVPQTVQKPKVKVPPSFTVLNLVPDNYEIEDDGFDFNPENGENLILGDYTDLGGPEEEVIDEEEIFRFVKNKPSFPGGETALNRFLASNIEYPTMARESDIQGKVFLTFVVEKDGSITDVKLLRGIGGGCDDEAIRVVKIMPKWSPGKQNGRTVRVQFTLPVKFVLQ